MDPEKFVELQKQMRENNQEVADFLSDFTSWKEQVESKDARLKNQKETKSLPAVRNSLFKKQKKKRGDQATTSGKQASQRIRSSDYRAWDKFDVDKALEEVDKSDPGKEASKDSESSETDEELENQRRLILSKEARELGNQRFKEGKFEDAVEQYTTSVRLTPEDPVPYTNRALAFLKLERYASAESDCTAALALDKKCVKALFRRAMARKGLQKKTEAIEDLKHLLALDEHNKPAITELTLLTGQSPCATKTGTSEARAEPSSAPKVVSLRGSRKLRRIPIVEVGGGAGSQSTLLVANSKVAKNPPRSTGEDRLPTSLPITPPEIKNIPNTVSVTGDASASDLLNVQTNVSQPVKKPHVSHTGSVFTTPSNWYQLERDLRELSGAGQSNLSQSAVNYLCALEPVDYPKIIGSNLEPDFLSKLLYALHSTDKLTIEDIASRLDALSHLPRFDVAWCLADNHERDLFERLLSKMDVSQNLSAEFKQRLRTAYL